MTTACIAPIGTLGYYLCVTLDETDEQARQRFVKRYGKEPAEVVRDNNLIWCGPVSSKQKRL